MAPAVSLSQLIVGSGQDLEGSVLAATGDPVPVFYSVHNQGNVALDLVAFPAGDYSAGDTNQDGLLDINEVWEFVSSHTAVAGPQQIAASISAVEPVTGVFVKRYGFGDLLWGGPECGLSVTVESWDLTSGLRRVVCSLAATGASGPGDSVLRCSNPGQRGPRLGGVPSWGLLRGGYESGWPARHQRGLGVCLEPYGGRGPAADCGEHFGGRACDGWGGERYGFGDLLWGGAECGNGRIESRV